MKKLLIICLLVSTGLPARAEFSRSAGYSPAVNQDRYEQRRAYLDALQMIRNHEFTRYRQTRDSLRTYALYPYLEYTYLSYRISGQGEKEINDFREQYADTPLVEPLMQHWLSSLAKHGKWQLFTKYYPEVTPDKVLACQYGTALIKTGRNAEAMQHAESLWRVGYSQPDECDPIFNFWRTNDGLTPELAWERFAMALDSGQSKLSKYLLRFIDRSEKSYASNYRLVHYQPKTIKRYSSFRRDHLRNREIILHGVRRYARVDAVDAVEVLQRYETMHNFEPDALEATWAYVGERLAKSSSNLSLTENLPVNLHKFPSLIEARIRQSLKYGDFSNVLVLINLLPEDMQATDRWQYWKARVLARSEGEPDRISAREIFQTLAEERSFYGFLSADILDESYNFEDESTEVTLEQILSLEVAPGIQRALELYSLGERSRARREWYFSTAGFTPSERAVAARVALRWGWYKAAIQSMIDAANDDASHWNHLDFRFPVAYRDNFLAWAQRANIPVHWSLAIARQESAFMPDARSSAGALGLMQLLPSTAQLVARGIGVKYSDNKSLWQPDLNIQLGSHYLGDMLRRFNNNRILASAAYNAGPGRVDRWLDPTVPFDVWIEVIPFGETRGYVQNVLMFSSIYSRRMGERQPLLYAHERDFFSAQQVTDLKGLPEKPAVETAEPEAS